MIKITWSHIPTGLRNIRNMFSGEEDGIPKTPAVGFPFVRCAGVDDQSPGQRLGGQKTSIAHGNGGSYIRGPYSHEPARLEVLNLAMQGVGKPGRHQVKMIEWNHKGDFSRIPIPCPDRNSHPTSERPSAAVIGACIANTSPRSVF